MRPPADTTPTRGAYFSNISITRLATIFGAALILSQIAITGLREYKDWKLEIHGTEYLRLAEAKDFVADILPPPLFLVEAHLEAHVLADRTDELKERRKRLARMKDEHDAQLKKWAGSALPQSIKSDLAGLGGGANQAFWDAISLEFLPAVEQGNRVAASAALARIGETFNRHREAALKIIARANEHLKQVEAEAAHAGWWLKWSTLVVTTALFLLVAALVAAMRWLISRPLRLVADRTHSLAGGDLSSPIPFENGRNEIGRIAGALHVFRSAAIERQRLATESAEQQSRIEDDRQRVASELQLAVKSLGSALGQLASGDLTARVSVELARDYQALKIDFNTAIERLEEAVSAVRSGSDAIMAGTNEIAQASDDLSRRTETQAASLEETAATIEQITSTVKKTAECASQARDMVSTAKADAEKCGAVVRRAIEAMSSIERSSKQISQIIGVIDEIAFQTNLLALNAGVEAARAGDAGRGFAVVASEVRALAQRSAEAARQIKDLISTSTAQVDEGVEFVGETGTALERIVAGVTEINVMVGEIAAGAQEQATGLQQVNIAVNQMDQVTQQNAAMVEQATAGTRTLAEQTNELAQLVARFVTRGQSAAEPLRAALQKTVPHAFAAPAQQAVVLPRPATRPAPKSKAPAKPRLAAAGGSAQGWEEF